ncbi:MAG: cyanoexosortase A [Drouetiella hepatica Uher 2000/2452]|jgi:cyanoexosortase A|uniref:Cyanoexosortase A n=1 Tax=Drouetiella hepatica Uher 2000/2452 TaxID=904376 RepID=A0A951UQ43_9CYAN|nr:cyanoexosortase A [Drouetiella hepatica Uher 2000/2452]
MKVIHPISARLLQKSQYWLLGTAAALVAIYMTLVWLSGNIAHFGMSILFYLSAMIVFWEKRHSLVLQSSVLSKVLGAALIGFSLWGGSILLHDPQLTSDLPNPVLRLFPFVSALAISLLTSGLQGLKRYRQELTLLFFLGGPSVIFTLLPDISPITARFATFLLWYTGFNVSVQDVYINLPTGGVKVYTGCSGIESMAYLLGIAVIGLILFPVSRSKQILVPIIALLIGFGVNGVRVALMAILGTAQNQELFHYWHEGEGSSIFGVVAMLVFGLCYWLICKQQRISDQKF